MNNFLISIKWFITNKNTVTVIGVIAILGLLYWGYNSVIDSQVKPIRVPIANQTIQPRTLITDNMISYIEIPAVAVTNNVQRNSNLIIGKYSAVNSVIPAGSMFYNDVLIDEEQNKEDCEHTQTRKSLRIPNFLVNQVAGKGKP